jgi:hypothetical protein
MDEVSERPLLINSAKFDLQQSELSLLLLSILRRTSFRLEGSYVAMPERHISYALAPKGEAFVVARGN